MAYKNQKKNKLHIKELRYDSYLGNIRYENAEKKRKKKKRKYLAVLKTLLTKKNNYGTNN